MPNKQKKFQHIIDASMEFAQAKDVDLLLEKILGAVKALTNADAGSIYLLENNVLRFHHTQQNALPSPKHCLYHTSAPAVIAANSIPFHVARTGDIVNISALSSIPENGPYTFDRSYIDPSLDQVQSVLAFPLKNSAENVIGVIQLLNIRDDKGEIIPLSEDDTPLVQLFATNAANAIERAQTTRARVLGIIQILTALRDTEETVAHVNRVGAYAAEIYETWARKKNLPPEVIASQKDLLRMAGMLHDLGKLAIPNVIRRKPGRLSQEEYNTMKQHTIKGAQLLLKYAHSEIEEVAAQIALTHHERWDGTGYPGYIDPYTGDVLPGHEGPDDSPQGKKGDNIPVFGRVVAIADVYDALSNHRVFRQAWKEEDVLEKLKNGAGTHFDPDMIDAFFESLETIRSIGERYPD